MNTRRTLLSVLVFGVLAVFVLAFVPSSAPAEEARRGAGERAFEPREAPPVERAPAVVPTAPSRSVPFTMTVPAAPAAPARGKGITPTLPAAALPPPAPPGAEAMQKVDRGLPAQQLGGGELRPKPSAEDLPLPIPYPDPARGRGTRTLPAPIRGGEPGGIKPPEGGEDEATPINIPKHK